MDEASSKFVDQIVMEKLLTEKLEKVHHYPSNGLTRETKSLFEDFDVKCKAPNPEKIATANGFRFASPVNCTYSENTHCEVISHTTPSSRGSILFIHGLFEENRKIYDSLFQELSRNGFDIYNSTLPFHYSRTPEKSEFSGEFFWSADYTRTRSAFKQAVYELHTLYKIIQEETSHPVYICGFSMGGCVALLLSALCSDIPGIVAINPAVSLSATVWDSPLCRTIKKDYFDAGYKISELQEAFRDFEPASLRPSPMSIERTLLIYGIYDQVTALSQYEQFQNNWNLKNVHSYKSGHLNALRTPRLAADITSFFDSIQSKI